MPKSNQNPAETQPIGGRILIPIRRH